MTQLFMSEVSFQCVRLDKTVRHVEVRVWPARSSNNDRNNSDSKISLFIRHGNNCSIVVSVKVEKIVPIVIMVVVIPQGPRTQVMEL